LRLKEIEKEKEKEKRKEKEMESGHFILIEVHDFGSYPTPLAWMCYMGIL
jgi:hypothetical protein